VLGNGWPLTQTSSRTKRPFSFHVRLTPADILRRVSLFWILLDFFAVFIPGPPLEISFSSISIPLNLCGMF
jgi:hypothetical protein